MAQSTSGPMDFRDPFKDLTFDGRPGRYREFRRKVILSVAALEDKNQHLAGPKLLSRLSGEAWRCTEHLSVAELRSDKGWLLVLDTLDKHYRIYNRHLPEVELHESIDEFLFHLKKRPAEGTTAFSDRFKTALSRLENLIQQEREAAHAKRRRRGDSKRRLEPASPVASSLEDSDDLPRRQSESAEHTDDTDENVEPPAQAEPDLPEPQPAQAKASGAEPSEPQPKAVPRRAPSAASEFASGRDSVRSSIKGSKKAKSTTGTDKKEISTKQNKQCRECLAPWSHHI